MFSFSRSPRNQLANHGQKAGRKSSYKLQTKQDQPATVHVFKSSQRTAHKSDHLPFQSASRVHVFKSGQKTAHQPAHLPFQLEGRKQSSRPSQ